MSYGEDKMKFTVREGVTVISQEMEFCGKVINVEVRISETYGFVRTVLTDNATGQDIDLVHAANETHSVANAAFDLFRNGVPTYTGRGERFGCITTVLDDQLQNCHHPTTGVINHLMPNRVQSSV